MHQHHGTNFLQPANQQVGQPLCSELCIHPFGCLGSQFVNRFRFVGLHPSTPFSDCRAVLAASWFVDSSRRIDLTPTFTHPIDVRQRCTTAIGEPLFRLHLVPCFELFGQGQHRRLVCPLVVHFNGHDYAALGGAGQMNIVGRTETTVSHLHDPCFGIRDRGPFLFFLIPLSILRACRTFLFRFRQLLEGPFNTLFAILCGLFARLLLALARSPAARPQALGSGFRSARRRSFGTLPSAPADERIYFPPRPAPSFHRERLAASPPTPRSAVPIRSESTPRSADPRKGCGSPTACGG